MNAKIEVLKIVDVKKGVPKTTTLQIALGLGVQHKSVIQLVRSYKSDFSEFGLVTFEMSNSAFEMSNWEHRQSTRGRHTEYAALNEQQATLLLTYMRNSPKVREFKKALVRAFFEARTLLQTDYFFLLQKREALNAKLECEKDIASACGKGLSTWKKQRDILQTAITNVDRQIQPCLFE
ncbi:hypothetical protein E0H89_03545 [Acinetobacter sp. ANC 3781]|uniref:Rha family transcriptional regulator n=1 Tax=Acinetobacter sp. ANC 3781 TaxID=2529835 RepID=UPI00103DFE9E|nr:Rha family transcriptional regulator [Acinetobacter sp. ANC 3781]TCB79340.1 hypothetical protein E0H89_03545 [Acinetobacter sp. ANC 3781]